MVSSFGAEMDGAAADGAAAEVSGRPAKLCNRPKFLHKLWKEGMEGMGENKVANDFTAAAGLGGAHIGQGLQPCLPGVCMVTVHACQKFSDG